MTPREILEAAVASLPEGLPRPEFEPAPGIHLTIYWPYSDCSLTLSDGLDCWGDFDTGDAPTLRAVAHVLGEVARLLEQERAE